MTDFELQCIFCLKMDSLKEVLLQSITNQVEATAVVDCMISTRFSCIDMQPDTIHEYTYADLLKQQEANEELLSAFQIDSSHIVILLLPVCMLALYSCAEFLCIHLLGGHMYWKRYLFSSH